MDLRFWPQPKNLDLLLSLHCFMYTYIQTPKPLSINKQVVGGWEKQATALPRKRRLFTINEKHQVQRPETCYQNYIICTQGPWAVPASCEARRFFVIEPDEKYAGNQTAESVAYFESVAAVKPEHFAHFLYNRDISGFKSTIVPETKALTKQKEQSLMPVQSALLECLQRGFLPGFLASDDTGPAFEQSFGDRILRNSMQDDWTANFKTQHGWPNTPQKFWQALDRLE